MSFSSILKKTEQYLLLTAEGSYSYADMLEFVDKSMAGIEKSGFRRVIVDISKVLGNIPDEERFNLGVYCSQFLTGPLTIALVYRENDINHLFEHVAWNEGVRVSVVGGLEQATTLLTKGNSSAVFPGS